MNNRNKKSLNLRTKVTLLAIAIGVLPVAVVGYLSHNILNRSLTRQISQEQLEKTEIAADNVTRFLEDRVHEIDALAQHPLFTDSKLRDGATLEEKAAVLDNFANKLKYYNSILFFDLQGDLLFQASIEKPYTGNYSGKDYFQEAIKTQTMTINGPGLSPSSGQLRVEFAVPVKDKVTGELLGIIRAKIPGNFIQSLFEVYEKNNEQWYLVNEKGTIFAGNQSEYLNQSLETYFPTIEQLHETKENGVIKSVVPNISSTNQSEKAPEQSPKNFFKDKLKKSDTENDKQLVSYVAAQASELFPSLHIGTIIAKDEKIALATLKIIDWTLFFGTTSAVILVAAIAIYMAKYATIPLTDAVTALKKIGLGQLDTRLTVTGDDELGELSSNINLMAQQIQNSLEEQKNLAQQQQEDKEKLEQEIYQLLDEVQGALDGDLTVRASLSSMEMSTVADLFNAIIDNLSDIAIRVKESSSQVSSSLGQNEQSIQQLAEQAIKETEETRKTLGSVEQMYISIEEVAENANQAAQFANDAYNVTQEGTQAIAETAQSIIGLRTTVGETAKKMKRLGESSQKISQVVSLIEEIALKTNLLAINASVEASRAGEQGQGFSIVAEQVGALAEQSATATKEISKIVEAIQQETQEVSEAMELGTTQVVESTRLVEDTQKRLQQVLERSQRINELMQSISQATISQTDTSRSLTELMQEIAQLAEQRLNASQEVAQSMQNNAQVAKQLESVVEQFKVS
jgi:twitching motility protein PilJ